MLSGCIASQGAENQVQSSSEEVTENPTQGDLEKIPEEIEISQPESSIPEETIKPDEQKQESTVTPPLKTPVTPVQPQSQQEEDVFPKPIVPLTDEMENRIKGDYLYTNFNNIPDYLERYPIEGVMIRKYYGTYNDCVVIYIQGYKFDLQILGGEEVAGYKFNYPTPRTIRVWKDGEFYGLSYALEKGFLSEEDIKNIHYYHTSKS